MLAVQRPCPVLKRFSNTHSLRGSSWPGGQSDKQMILLRLLQESNLAARQPPGTTSVLQAIMGEGLAQGPYVVARGGVEPMTFLTEGTDNIHLTNHTP